MTDTETDAGSPSPTPPRPARRSPLVPVVVGVTLAAILAAVLAVGVGFGGDDADGDMPTGEAGAEDGGWHGTLLGEPLARPAFTLTDTEGRPYDFAAETQGQLTLLFFGYTNCPDICPIHMATLASALERPGMPDPTVVFVTTDPGRDTPERLREWLDTFGTDIVGLTGTVEDIAAAEQAAGLAPSFPVGPDGAPLDPDSAAGSGDYEVGHASSVVAFAPDDHAYLAYPAGAERDDWAADLPRLAGGEVPDLDA